VVFDRDAHVDFGEMREYIARARGREFADAFIERIIRYCESFAIAPHRGTKRDAIRPGLRTVTWRRTVTIAFEVQSPSDQVVILGAVYRGRDVASILKQRNPRLTATGCYQEAPPVR
jgi:toxin ParE1/3/4